jgi:hypothetical protein
VCDAAQETCPVLPRPVERLQVSFPGLALAEGTDDEKLAVLRRGREVIRERLRPRALS